MIAAMGSSTTSILKVLTANRTTVVGSSLFLGIVLLAICAPLLAPYDPFEQNILNRLENASAGHWMGTDLYGRDTLSRALYGLRLSLVIGLSATAIAFVIGTALGILAGFKGGWVDAIIMRAMDILLAFPTLITGLMIVAVLGASVPNIIIAIVTTIVPNFARVARAPTIALKEREFVEACRALGYSDLRIMVVHIFPNVFGDVLVLASLWAAYAIRVEAYLSFIGLGIAPPVPTLGSMIREGFEKMLDAPWVTIYPSLVLLLVVFALNLVGDGVRDATDPKLRGQ